MALYKVEISKKVRKKDLSRIPVRDVDRIVERIKSLADNPYPADAVGLKGREEWRARQSEYRILYLVYEQIVTVLIIKVGHRREVYKT